MEGHCITSDPILDIRKLETAGLENGSEMEIDYNNRTALTPSR